CAREGGAYRNWPFDSW
nr:immunoglobulin heavy chain junction region [Macaca mulatta]MOW97049.1 immunoglobulin heavy chain junction region [Macaca mulatta]